jgi:CheY-like chemotaxis protein
MTMKIFVADDSVTTQKVVGLAFSGEDVTVEAVSNGNAALDSIKKFRPDVVLADVVMPGCNGYEVCARIKEDPEFSGVPVILLVGAFEPFDELEAARVRSDGCLTKPFDTSELTRMIRSLISKQPALQEGQPARPQQKEVESGLRGTVSRSVLDSFLGSNRILDLISPETVNAYAQARVLREIKAEPDNKVLSEGDMPEDLLNAIVDKVVRRMSNEVVREVAWEVVPELSEAIIRRSLEERNKSSS